MLPTLTPKQRTVLLALHDLSGDEDQQVATDEVAARVTMSGPAAAAVLRSLVNKGFVYGRKSEVHHRYGTRLTTTETFWRLTTPTRERWQEVVA